MDASGFVHEFGRLLRDRNAAIMCGAGISVPSGLPDWQTVLEPIREELGVSANFRDMPLLCSYFIQNVPDGRSRLTERVLSQLSQGATPSETHHAVWRLPINYVWSLNYDDLLEQAVDGTPRVISTDSGMQGSFGGVNRTIIKMHGGIPDYHRRGHEQREIVISREDFDSYPESFPRTWSRLMSDYHNKSFLFLGISFQDPNMEYLMKMSRTAGPSRTQTHYTIVEGPPGGDASIRKEYEFRIRDMERGGIRVVEVSSYDEIPDLLQRVSVAARRPTVAVIGSPPPDAEEGWLRPLEMLGNVLSERRAVDVICAGNEPGLATLRCFSENLIDRREYLSSRARIFRRALEDHDISLPERSGVVEFSGTTFHEIRTKLMAVAGAVIVAGGGEGTWEEIRLAEDARLPVIPIPRTGGAAQAYADEVRAGKRLGIRDIKQLDTGSDLQVAQKVCRIIDSLLA